MLKVLLTSIALVLCIRDAHASVAASTTIATSASSSSEDTPFNLVRTHLSFFGAKLDAIPEISDAEYGIQVIAITLKQIDAIEHKHVKDGCGFGYSFNNKNDAPINAVVELMTGKKNWKKETIEGLSDFSIADAGCGVGLSAVTLVSTIAEFYKTNKWTLKAPIKLDLFDISAEHQVPLFAFAKLVNMAYPQYFRVRTYVHDVAKPLPEQNTYRIVLALNVMHYMPQDHWGAALKNIEDSMQQSGMLFLTVDHYCAITANKITVEPSLQSARLTTSPFCMPTVLLFDPQLGQDKGTNLSNTSFINIVNAKSKAIPGGRYKFDEIDVEELRKVITHHMELYGKTTSAIYLQGKSCRQELKMDKILRLLSQGQLALQLSNYGFDDDLLEKAIAESYPSGKLKKLKLGWVRDLLKTSLDLPSTVGITLMKQ